MLKSIQLKLLKVKYSGDSVGRDIRIEIEILGKFLGIDKRIEQGTTMGIDREVGRFETDQELLQAEVFITVIEKDFLFNDVGSTKSNVKVNTVATKPQQFVFEVQVRESRSLLSRLFWGKRTAIFEMTLETQMGEIERYTPDTEDGWLVAQDNQGVHISLSAYIMVHPKSIKDSREYFIPSEGIYRDKLLSVPLKDDNSSYLIANIKHESMVSAEYSISEKVFTLNGKKYKTIDYPEAPWKKGIYNIGIPDYPHGSNNAYTEAIKQKVWFPIDFENARYLHVGARSAGCMTITETTKWMEIYNTLIKARKGDFKNVGILKVID
ncbi:MAG: hypothetical protein A2719_03935 [Candidatus Ryanbacteria bacterium RIFCSPHIGHO2_01_FULL_45_22]|uniref:Uncharacterized protein n=1 Tax=Candidatus Ryanbacteria bacterium RIFCSPHIGHO2_01_FULL_45_22 TaxID=1802114 RepID=A0A1G2FYY9_9BACT|nr:MAG: hypothetical protein A2719_03935 [Candidatus Ryanbacteria bacterium RIFCSPHIGHO2_01_FULL_45_22]